MAQLVFINLPVRDLERSKRFFEALGYAINPQFSDDTAACVVFSDHIYAMLLTEPKMLEFTPGKSLVDAAKHTEVITALSSETRAGVDQLLAKAVAAGGREYRDPEEYDFMYGRSFEDLDGHIWEVVWMDPSYNPDSDVDIDEE